jgi:hypothetical protein
MANVNIKLLNEVIADIEANPKSWRQETWHSRPNAQHPCGTAHCIAGHTALKSSDYAAQLLEQGIYRGDPSDVAAAMLGLSEDDAYYLFNASRSWEDIKRFQAAANLPAARDLLQRCRSMLSFTVSEPEEGDGNPAEDSVLLRDLTEAIDAYTLKPVKGLQY